MRTSRRRGNGFLAGFLLGAACAYYFDFERGRARRAELRQRMGSRFRRGRHDLEREFRHTMNEAEGAILERIKTPEEPADDLTLLDRVRSEVGSHPAVPKGELNLEVVDGVVTVHGQVEDQAHIDAVEQAILAVPGVKGVRSLMHVPGTPAPNKVESLQAG